MALNIADLVEHAVDAAPDNIALIVDDDPLTYRELEAASNRIAHHFLSRGLGTGSHVGLLSANSIEHVVVMIALLKIRAVPINLNYRYTASELAYICRTGDLDGIFYQLAFESVVVEAGADLPRLQHFLVDGGEGPTSYRHALESQSPERDFDPDRAWEIVDRHRVQIMFMTGDAMGRPLIEAFEAGDYDGSSLVAVASSAAIFSSTVKRKWLNAFPNVMFSDSVGSTEVGSSGVGLLSADSVSDDGPVVSLAPGAIILDDDFRILDPETSVGRVVRTGRAGHVPLGYYGDEEKSKATFLESDGVRFAITGDFARVEEGRRLTLLGRGSGCINTGGEKVFPEQVEIALKSHPMVYDALVVGVPDERWGSKVAALIQLRPGDAPTTEAIQDHVRTLLAGYKVPRTVVFTPEMPRHVTGKANYPLAQQLVSQA